MADTHLTGRRFACLGDSITSDQVTGIGTLVAQKLGMTLTGNFACGYATCSDWHEGKKNITPATLAVPPNTNTPDNVLSNQVRRLLAAAAPLGKTVRWRHPAQGEYFLDPAVGLGLGGKAPEVIYIAISTNDGNNPCNAVTDDAETVLAEPYGALDRTSIASALRYAVETLQCAFPYAQLFVATPLQTWTDQPWMSYENTRLKRDIIVRVCREMGVKVIDSFYESGFSRLIAREHGEVHPDEGWKENIASFVAAQILAKC